MKKIIPATTPTIHSAVSIALAISFLSIILLLSGCGLNIEKTVPKENVIKTKESAAKQAAPKEEKTAAEMLAEMRKKVGINMTPPKTVPKTETLANASAAANKSSAAGNATNGNSTGFYMSRYNFLKTASDAKVGGPVTSLIEKQGEITMSRLTSPGSQARYRANIKEYLKSFQYEFFTDDEYHSKDKVNFWVNKSNDIVKVEKIA